MTQTERMAAAVGKHVERHTSTGRVDRVEIFPAEATSEGWMEWIIRYHYYPSGGLTVGAILRTTDQENVEFHS